MRGGGWLAIYLVGLGLIWLLTANGMRREPTTHGQDVLFGMGFLLGLLWPLFIAYLIVASPWIAWQLWRTRGER